MKAGIAAGVIIGAAILAATWMQIYFGPQEACTRAMMASAALSRDNASQYCAMSRPR